MFKLLPIDNTHMRCPDITKAKKLLGWQPKVEHGEALKIAIGWFRDN